jgi:hypothetical protein
MLGILALDSYHALATNHFAFTANFLNRCPDLHDFSYDLTFSENDPSPRQVIGRKLDLHFVSGEYFDVVHTHLAGNMSQHLMAIV